MFNPLLHVDRRQLAAKLYNDPSLALSGDSKRVMKHRQEISTAITRKNTDNTPDSSTNINREALHILDSYPISCKKPRDTARISISANSNYFAPSYSPKNFKFPISPRNYSNSQDPNKSCSASTYNNKLGYALAEGTDNRFVSWRKLSAKPRPSMQSTAVQRITTSASSYHESQSVHSNIGNLADNISTMLSQDTHEGRVRWIDNKNSESFTRAQSQAFQNIHLEKNKVMLMETQVAEEFNSLRHEILSYLKDTESVYPRSPLEISAINEMLTDLEAKQQTFTNLIKSEYRDSPITLCRCLSDAIDIVSSNTNISVPSTQITSYTKDNSVKKNVKLTHLNFNDFNNSPSSILSLFMKTQKTIQNKLNALKATRLQYSDTNYKSHQDTTSSLHDPLCVKPVYPWIRGRSSSTSRFSTSQHVGDYQTEESEIGIAPFNASRQLSNSQVDDCINSQVFREFTLSTSTDIAPRTTLGNNHVSRESRDYDSPAVALVFSKELDNLSNECLHESQTEFITESKNYINCHATVATTRLAMAHNLHSERNNMFVNTCLHIDKFKEASSPRAMSVPANSHMQQDTRDISSPDVVGVYTSKSVQRITIDNLKTPNYDWKPRVVKLENTIGCLEKNKSKHKSAIGILQPRKRQAYHTVKDYTENELDYPNPLLRVPMSSPQRVNLELDLQSIDSMNSPLKFGFFSTLKMKIAEETQRANETITGTYSYINTETQELTDTNNTEKYNESIRSPSRFTHMFQDNNQDSSSNKALLIEIRKYITNDTMNMYAKFIGTLQEELAKKLSSIEKDLQNKIKALAKQRKAEYESVRVNITKNKGDIMSRISYLQDSIRTVLAAHKSGAKKVEKKVQLSLARAGIHERIPQISQVVIEKIKHLYCALSRCLGNWVAMGYEQCTAITCQGTAGNGVRYILLPCGDSICDTCQSTNPSICPICLRKYELSIKADDSYYFNGSSTMLPTRIITSICSRLREILLSLMELEDVEVFGYDDAEKKFAAKDSTASWQAYSRKLDMKEFSKKQT